MTNSPHVPFFRPLIRLLEERGHEVRVSARDFAQTLELLDAAAIGARGRRAAPRRRRARGQGAGDGIAPPRAPRLGRGRRRFDLALSHASHELPLAARSLRVRSAYAYDYEFARAQHTLGSRAATRVVVPEAIPQDRLDRLGATRREGAPLPRAEGGVLPPGLLTRPRGARRARPRPDAACSSSCARRPRSRSTTATGTRSSPTCSSGSAPTPRCRRSCSRGRRPSATRCARRRCRRSSCPSTRSTPRA